MRLNISKSLAPIYVATIQCQICAARKVLVQCQPKTAQLVLRGFGQALVFQLSGKGGGAQGEHEGITAVERTLDGLAFDADQGRIADAKLLNLVLAYALGARNSLRRSIAPTHGEPIAPVANVDLFRSISPIAQFLL